MTRKTNFFEGCSWFKFNNLGLALGMALKFYNSVAKGLSQKVLEASSYVSRSYMVKTGREPFCLPPSWIGLRFLGFLRPFLIKIYLIKKTCIARTHINNEKWISVCYSKLSKWSSIYHVRKTYRKTNISHFLIRTRTCASQGVKKVFWKNLCTY